MSFNTRYFNNKTYYKKRANDYSNGYESREPIKREDKKCVEKTDDKSGDKSDNKNNNHLNIDKQRDEVIALKSIFDDKVLAIDETQMKGRFLAEPVLSDKQFSIVYKKRRNGLNRNDCGDGRQKCEDMEQFLVQHLPPIELYFELPENYPTKSHPKFLISCKWLSLSNLEIICEKLETLWLESKMEILFTWFSFLQNELLNCLDYNKQLDISSIINVKPKWVTKTETNSVKNDSISTVLKLAVETKRNPHRDRYHRNSYNNDRYYRNKDYSNNNSEKAKHVIEFKPSLFRGRGLYDSRAACDLIGPDLINHLKAYNEFKKNEIFNATYITCNICFSMSLGQDCITFPCNHINCRKCIVNYFTTLVNEGSVNQLKCPEPKCETTAPNTMVRELISPELYKKYDELLLASIIGTMNDVYYCPRKACGSVVIGDADSSLAHCTTCSFAFCKHCKYTYHGLDPCQIFRNSKERKQILEKYREATGNEKLNLEKLYGKKQLTSALEEDATEQLVEETCKRCPHCKASIEKSDGCNKMSCWRCSTYFCWICAQKLPTTLPYSHYNDPQSKCFNQLFRGVNWDDLDDIFEDIVP